MKSIRRRLGLLAFVIATGVAGPPANGQVPRDKASADFALRDGDTVVFLGDSNTQWGSYVKDIENYTVLRFPKLRIRFINVGLEGDMMSKAFFRLDRDVFGRGATVLVVLFGLNDVSWGVYADSAIRQVFFEYTAKIVDAARARNVRTYVLSYPVTAPAIGASATNGFFRLVGTLTTSDTSLLQRVGDEAMKIARAHGAETIDVQRDMRRVLAALPPGTRLNQDDGGHLNELGSQLLAVAILRGFGAPTSVSSVVIDIPGLRVVNAEKAVVSKLTRSGAKIEFTRLDKGLPLTFPKPVLKPPSLLEKLYAPVNGYFLKLTGLTAGARFDLRAEGLSLAPRCGFTSGQLGSGVNLAALGSTYYVPRGPWVKQAIALGYLTDAKAELESSVFYQAQNELDSESWNSMRSRAMTALENVSSTQKAIASPAAYRFELEQLTPEALATCANQPLKSR